MKKRENLYISTTLKRKVIIETPRLKLSEIIEEEPEEMYLLNSDYAVIQYTGDDGFKDVEAARQLIINYPQYKKYGYGRWTARLKENNEFIGWCGLKFNEDIEEIDIGYRLLKKHWNKGYATEAARACLKFGFTQLNMKRIIGRAEKENTASIRIFEKLNMQFEKNFIEEGKNCVQYAINV